MAHRGVRPPAKHPRGICPECRETVVVRKDGRLRLHGYKFGAAGRCGGGFPAQVIPTSESSRDQADAFVRWLRPHWEKMGRGIQLEGSVIRLIDEDGKMFHLLVVGP